MKEFEAIYQKNKAFIEHVLVTYSKAKFTFEDVESNFLRAYWFAGYQDKKKIFRVFGTREDPDADPAEERSKKQKRVQFFHMMINQTHDEHEIVKVFIEFCERFEQIRLMKKMQECENNIANADEIAFKVLNDKFNGQHH